MYTCVVQHPSLFKVLLYICICLVYSYAIPYTSIATADTASIMDW